MPAKTPHRQSYPLPAEFGVMLEGLLNQALQSNQPLKLGIDSLAASLKLKGTYGLRLKPVFEPLEAPSTEGN